LETLARPFAARSSWLLPILFAAGFVVLAATWTMLYRTEAMFTESHLVGYYCCATEQDLPESGTLERTLSDFFRTSPGKHLPSLLFVGAYAGLFAVSLRRGSKRAWWLPWLFIIFSIIYILVDFQLLVVSWSIGDLLVGPQTGIYKGYERTCYGIALHLILWIAFFATISTILWRLLPRSRAVSRAGDS
jgi:hypothetical protein